ncbi:hypothetical protein [Streptacidiphilus rugosus]|uniref:hypothetical protein n=1 Tax=Streptacidiphilus rugosus TaxID=405783 RepID=UPI000564968D|nr:hypothetical protein [Streptacidiphilus rugosus]
MTPPRLTHSQLERVVASLRGLRVTGVEYALMTGSDEDGREPLTWDRGTSHEPTHGCRLTTDLGVRFTFTWGNTFGCYGLEVFEQPLEAFLTNIGELWGPVVVPVASHPRWQQLLGREIVGTELAWVDWASGGATPCWVRLDLGPDAMQRSTPESVWIAAGRWQGDRFQFATDDVTVIFDRAEARRTAIMK